MHESLAPSGGIPRDLENVGRVIGAWGLKGEIKIKPYSQEASALLAVKSWWLEQSGMYGDFEVTSAKAHSGSVIAQLNGIADRNAADGLRGREIWISRSNFPVLPDDEYYWVELIGLKVINLAGENMGHVTDLIENGAHATLEVRQDSPERTEPVLIPFVGAYIKAIERAAGRIVVDWNRDY